MTTGKKSASQRHRDVTITPGRRFETGCIATLTDGTAIVTRHFVGSGADATRAVAAFCDERGLRVQTLSTPMSVYRDLQGHREAVAGLGPRLNSAPATRSDRVLAPEPVMLGRIGRLDLLDR